MFKVFNEKSADPKKEVFFKLEQRADAIALVLVDKHGIKLTAGNVLTIDEDGLHRMCSVTTDAPFKMTEDECIFIGDDR